MEELIEKLKVELIEALNLEEITPEDIDSEAPLVGDDGLGLDSIDALEIILILERNYGIKIENPAKGKEIFEFVLAIHSNELFPSLYVTTVKASCPPVTVQSDGMTSSNVKRV